MACNTEAIRAKEIAEKKMLSRDFVCAKKLLLKALYLCPDIENVSHMLTVCEVHCSAGNLINGQKDLYGVLQVEPFADESLIRKQYRKFALLLHPDKNKFAGAEAAFKLVGEAYKVLSDQTSRVVYDSKIRVQNRTMPSWNSKNVGINTGATIYASQYQYGGVKQQDKQQSSEFFASQYFWSVCVHCNNLLQYPRPLLNSEVQCPKCLKKGHAFEVVLQNVQPPASESDFTFSQTGFQQKDVPTHHTSNNRSPTHFGKSSETRVQENAANLARSKPSKSVFSATQRNASTNKVEKGEPESNLKSEKGKPSKMPASKNSTGGIHQMRTAVSSNDSGPAQNGSTGSDQAHPPVPRNEPTSGRYPRRTSRDAINVTYKEYESEDDFAHPSKRLRKVETNNTKNCDIPSPVVLKNGEKKKTSENPKGKKIGYEDLCKDNLSSGNGMAIPESKGLGVEEEKHVSAGSNPNSAMDSRVKTQPEFSFSYTDPEFYNFDMDRDQSKFAVNQIWAVYDDDDGMPRYYALIRKVFAPSFKLQYNWLEHNPTSLAEKAWAKARLPTACGNFKIGKVRTTNCQLMFSHLIFDEKGRGSTYDIYPKKGEVWALFNDWDMQWSSFDQNLKKYAYEFVEVLSDYAPGQDFTVSHLVKVKGFLYLFARAPDKGTAVIPYGQLLKFSHCIPFFRVSSERDRIPQNSFELDPAALPENVENDAVSAHTVEFMVAKNGNSTCPIPQADEDKFEGDATKCTMSRPTQDAQDIDPAFEKSCENIEGPVYNEQEFAITKFYNFQDERLEEKFEKGQIWSFNSDMGTYPNFYAWVMKPKFPKTDLFVKLLEFFPQTEEEKLWSKNGLPIGCGRFKVSSKVVQYGSTRHFSQLVNANSIKKNNLYEIYPNCGEVWAVFSNWSLRWTLADFERQAEYAVVEVIERRICVIKVRALTKAEDYKYVFMPESSSVAHVDIPIDESLRFSHQIPAFRLTDQESGKLKDCWELEPRSIPKNLSSMKP